MGKRSCVLAIEHSRELGPPMKEKNFGETDWKLLKLKKSSQINIYYFFNSPKSVFPCDKLASLRRPHGISPCR